MALLVSSWSNGVESVPKDYVMPPEKRAGDFVTICKEIPVINLQNDRSEIVHQILKACEEFGLFQVINHGVSDDMMADTMNLYSEFFNMPVEDKLGVYAEKSGKGCTLYTSGLNFEKEEVHYWKDTLKHGCHPLEEHTATWPDKPTRYREDVGRYSLEMRKMGFKILDLIGEGLGLKKGHFDEVGREQGMVINYYPLCPDPSLTMGIRSHIDPNLITLIQQDQYGLQLQKDGKWIGTEPIPNAFVVSLGYQFQIISNGKLKGAQHRVVTNSTAARTSIGSFFGPVQSLPIVIEPAKELVTSSSPQMFKSHLYQEFMADYIAAIGTSGTVLDSYRL